MDSKPEVMEYNSMKDLEQTIDEVYRRVNRLDTELNKLLEQVGAFLNYEHETESFRSAAEYVSSNISDEALPPIAMEYARKDLENPEEAENWSKLEEAVEKSETIHGQWRTAFQNLWSKFGFTDEERRQEIEGIPPFQHFLNLWEHEPYELFQDQETYDEALVWGEDRHEPTFARYFDIEEPTTKQRDDIRRQKRFEREEKMGEKRPYEGDEEILRDILNSNREDSRWVDQSKLDNENKNGKAVA